MAVSQKVENAFFPSFRAKAGIRCSQALTNSWTPFFNGVTTCCDFIKMWAWLYSCRLGRNTSIAGLPLQPIFGFESFR